LRPAPGLELAAADSLLALRPDTRNYGGAVVHVEADTLVWLRFSPGVYLRDWLAGWFDVLLNGARGMRRRTCRARLFDAVRALMVRRRDVGADKLPGALLAEDAGRTRARERTAALLSPRCCARAHPRVSRSRHRTPSKKPACLATRGLCRVAVP
jgi:hypothetical protein